MALIKGRRLISEKYKRTALSRIEGRPSETLERQLGECLKYLAIVSMTEGRRIPVTPEVDDVWHELLLQTSSYRQLCASLPGKKFLDHESIDPLSYNERVGDAAFVREWVQWIPDYVQSFGPFTAEVAQDWNVVRFLQDELAMSLEQINEFGANSEAIAVVPRDSLWSALS